MQTNRILYLLKAREIQLQTKMRKTERGKVPNLRTHLSYRVSEKVCDAIWILQLLRTSVSVTRTPLTTLKSMWKALTN